MSRFIDLAGLYPVPGMHHIPSLISILLGNLVLQIRIWKDDHDQIQELSAGQSCGLHGRDRVCKGSYQLSFILTLLRR